MNIKEMVEVMQASANGDVIEYTPFGVNEWVEVEIPTGRIPAGPGVSSSAVATSAATTRTTGVVLEPSAEL